MRIFAAIIGLSALGACAEVGTSVTTDQTSWNSLLQETDRAFDESFRDLPFDSGVVYVVANEHGDLHTYSLTPCGGETRICGGSGGVGHVQRTPDYFVVTGAYAGRTFYLSPGGDGILTWRGVNRDLAWN